MFANEALDSLKTLGFPSIRFKNTVLFFKEPFAYGAGEFKDPNHLYVVILRSLPKGRYTEKYIAQYNKNGKGTVHLDKQKNTFSYKIYLPLANYQSKEEISEAVLLAGIDAEETYATLEVPGNGPASAPLC